MDNGNPLVQTVYVQHSHELGQNPELWSVALQNVTAAMQEGASLQDICTHALPLSSGVEFELRWSYVMLHVGLARMRDFCLRV